LIKQLLLVFFKFDLKSLLPTKLLTNPFLKKKNQKRRDAMMRPGWAIRTKLDKAIRLRLPSIVLRELYAIKDETGLNVSEVVRLLLEYSLSNEEAMKKIFDPYKAYYQKQKQLKQRLEWEYRV
jgi:antitoxin component of RelBE/YafQ-DinJ toxin-antitoxin module